MKAAGTSASEAGGSGTSAGKGGQGSGAEAGPAPLCGLWAGGAAFWAVPLVIELVARRLLGSGLLDNGRLDALHSRWVGRARAVRAGCLEITGVKALIL